MGYFVTPLKPHEIVQKLTNFLIKLFPQAKIWVFGSFANGNFTKSSDIDIAIDAGYPLSVRDFTKVLEFIEELPTLRMVDVVDLQAVSSGFKKIVVETGMLVYDGAWGKNQHLNKMKK